MCLFSGEQESFFDLRSRKKLHYLYFFFKGLLINKYFFLGPIVMSPLWKKLPEFLIVPQCDTLIEVRYEELVKTYFQFLGEHLFFWIFFFWRQFFYNAKTRMSRWISLRVSLTILEGIILKNSLSVASLATERFFAF